MPTVFEHLMDTLSPNKTQPVPSPSKTEPVASPGKSPMKALPEMPGKGKLPGAPPSAHKFKLLRQLSSDEDSVGVSKSSSDGGDRMRGRASGVHPWGFPNEESRRNSAPAAVDEPSSMTAVRAEAPRVMTAMVRAP
jgi:hypothetical protein